MLSTETIYFIFFGIASIIFIVGMIYAYIQRKNNKEKSILISEMLKFSLKFLLIPIFVSMFIFIGTNMIQEKINTEFQKDNAPLILSNDIKIYSNNKNNDKLKISIPYKQGNIAKARIYFFENNTFNKTQKYDNIKCIPLKFNKKDNKLLTDDIPIKKEIQNNINIKGSSQKSFKYDPTMQFCVVIKDYKGNIIKRYYVIRPSYQSDIKIYRSLQQDGKTFINIQNCSNKLNEIQWTVDIGNNDAIKYDINILKNSNSHKMVKENFSPKFELATKEEQKIPAKKWKEIDNNNKKTGKTLANYNSKSAVIKATPTIKFEYYMPTNKEISYNIQAINDICREY